MNHKITLLAMVMVFTSIFESFAQKVKQYPLQDFFKNPEKANYQISRDGKYIAHTEPFEKRMNVFVQPLKGGVAKRVTSVTTRDISGYGWKGNRIVYVNDKGGDENFHLYSVDTEGQNLKDLTPFDSVKVGIIDDLKEHDTDILISMNKRKKEVFDVYRLNVVTGDLKVIAEIQVTSPAG